MVTRTPDSPDWPPNPVWAFIKRYRWVLATVVAALGIGVPVAFSGVRLVSSLHHDVAIASRAFHIEGTRIVDPDGNTFVPVGANVNGPSFVWQEPTLGQADVAADEWHWNTLRVNVCWSTADNYPDWGVVWPGSPTPPTYNGCENGGGFHSTTNNDLDALVSEYTARHIVVMVALQHFNPGFYPDATNMPFVEHWWQYIADRYKDNQYVWFNLLNEPGGDPSTLAQWNTVTASLAGKVRATGARNIIVADGSSVGQEAFEWKCTANIPYENSAILTYGPALQATYGNILFSLHAYNAWGGADRDDFSGCSSDTATFQRQLDTRFSNYLDHIRAANLPLVIGEVGSKPAPVPLDSWEAGQDAAVETVFRIVPRRGIGTLWWHGDAGSSYTLLSTTEGPWGCSWSHITNPAGCPGVALTPYGKLLYDYANQVNP